MDLSEEARKEPPESVIPMINVVFLLLIFFLMSATLAPPDPLEATPPVSASADGPAEARSALAISAAGEIGYQDLRGEAAIEAAAAASIAAAAAGDAAPLQIRADAAAPARLLAHATARLARAGAPKATIVVISAGEGDAATD